MRLFLVSSLFFLANIFFIYPAKAEPEFETKAPYAIGMDYNTFRVVYGKNIDERMAPSSMTKLMTIFILFQKITDGEISIDDEFLVSEKAWKKGGSKMFVKVGDRVRVEDLIRGIIVQSGNDACIVVAEAISGSEEAFAELMNEKAKEIGMKNTNFVNSTGWPDENHYSTVRDLAILTIRVAGDFQRLYPYFEETEFTYNGIKQYNRNRLLSKNDIDGLKTGHTEDGGYGIVVSGTKNGLSGHRRVIVVVNGLDSEKEREEEAYRLFRHVMDKYEQYIFYFSNEKVGEIPVWFGEEETVPAVTKEIIDATISKQDIEKDLVVALAYEGPLEAPVLEGDVVAYLQVHRKDEITQAFPLYAGKDIPRVSGLEAFFRKVEYYFSGGK